MKWEKSKKEAFAFIFKSSNGFDHHSSPLLSSLLSPLIW